jgi:hypothetical protein
MEYVTEEERKRNSFAALNHDRPCGGISSSATGGPMQEPPICEVHMLPWGHARKLVRKSSQTNL